MQMAKIGTLCLDDVVKPAQFAGIDCGYTLKGKTVAVFVTRNNWQQRAVFTAAACGNYEQAKIVASTWLLRQIAC
jgi:hypothetical protein